MKTDQLRLTECPVERDVTIWRTTGTTGNFSNALEYGRSMIQSRIDIAVTDMNVIGIKTESSLKYQGEQLNYSKDQLLPGLANHLTTPKSVLTTTDLIPTQDSNNAAVGPSVSL